MEWIPKSKPPTKAGVYLVVNDMSIVQEKDLQDYHSLIEIMYYSKKHNKWNTDSIVKAWMPLPEPPKI